MNYDFSERVVLITGSGSGIGRATAIKFAEAGAIVCVADKNIASAYETISIINSTTKKECRAIECNVEEETSILEMINEVVDVYGRIDHAYNNAGIGGEFAKVENYPTEDWDQVMQINLRGVFLCMKYELKVMSKQNSGTIVNCASLLATVAYENDSAYVASKFGVLGLTKNAALEYAGTPIRINAISPGFTYTPMILKAEDEKIKHLESLHPIGRLAKTDEIAQGVLWLSSDLSSFAIGTNLILDGGYTLQ